jgi:hypothetical protein
VFSLELGIKNGYYCLIVFGFECFDKVIVFKRKVWVNGSFRAECVELVCSHGGSPSCDHSNGLNDQGLNSEMVGQRKKQRQGFTPTPPDKKQRGNDFPDHLAKA